MQYNTCGSMFKTLNDLLLHNKNTRPKKIAYRFLANNGQNETITYEEIYYQVLSLAHKMQEYIAPFDRVLVSARPGLDFIIGFYACLLTRTIAVPAIPPADQMTAIRFVNILNNCSPTLILFDKKTATAIHLAKRANTFMPNMLKSLLGIHEAHKTLFNLMKNLKFDILNIDDYRHFSWNEADLPEYEPHDVAFLQYTSGSVGSPKGVMITHSNLLHNLDIIRNVIHCSVDSHMFSWLPPYHDMGLIAGIIEPFYMGAVSTLMSPLDFLARPARWVENLSKYQCTLTGAPNFAFELCALKTEDSIVKTLDLSALEVAANGAEPIHITAMNAFYNKFTKVGLRKGVILPCYGLAEATVMVSGKAFLSDDLILRVDSDQFKNNKVFLSPENHGSKLLISSGIPQLNVKIVHPENLTYCQDNEIGEIWIQGGSVSPGYFNNEFETEATFHAHIKDDPKQIQYFRSGDLGFIYNGSLFVCGRVKNMIIISGQNYYPQDIERAVIEADHAIRRGCVVAYASHFLSREGLTIVAEIRSVIAKKKMPLIIENIKKEIGSKFHLNIHEIMLVPPRSIPKTLSRKLQRIQTKNLINEGNMPIIHAWKAPEFSDSNDVALEILLDTSTALNPGDWLMSWLAHHLHQPKEQFSLETPFIAYGLDSIAISQLVYDCNNDMGIQLDPIIVWSYPTPQKLLNYIKNNKLLKNSIQIPHLKNTKDYPLSPLQERLWFTVSIVPEQTYFNLGCAYTLKGDVNMQKLKVACLETINKHVVLKSLIKNTSEGPKAYISHDLKDLFQEITIRTSSSKDFMKQIEEETMKPYDLSKGHLIRIRLFDNDTMDPILLIAVHHLVFDGLSMHLFMKDLISAYDDDSNDKNISAIHYYDYASWQRSQFKKDKYSDTLSYWLNDLNQAPTYLNLPLDIPRMPDRQTIIRSYKFHLSIQLSKEINTFCKNQSITPFILFISAFQLLLSHYAQQRDFVVGVPVNIRNQAETSHLVGFFINTLPIRVQLENQMPTSQFLQDNQKKLTDCYHHQNLSLTDLFSALALERHFSYEPLFQVLFVMQNLFIESIKGKHFEATALWFESGQSNHDLVLEIIPNPTYGAILKYNANLFYESTIERMVAHFKTLLKNMISNPEKSALSIPYMTEKEIKYFLNQPNQIKELSNYLSLNELFLKQVQETPNHIAIKFEQETLSYKTLDEKSNQLSHYLINKNIKANQMIAVSLPRSLDLVIGLIAIAKIGGGIFLP